MKQFLLLIMHVVLLAGLISCAKEDTGEPAPAILSLANIDAARFHGSVWMHVIGGKALVAFTFKGENSQANSIKDSLDLKNIASYSRSLAQGLYDISLKTKESLSIADTFIRFNANVKDFEVGQTAKPSLSATTNDGLITLSKEFVKDNSVPVFKSADSVSSSFNLGLINGYYYLYVKGGVSGILSFTSKATGQNLTKRVDVKSSNHYNLVLSIVNNSIDIRFGDFQYHEIPVTSNTIVTIIPDQGRLLAGDEVTYVLADEDGNILNVVKATPGFSSIKLSSKSPVKDDRFTVIQFIKPAAKDVIPSLTVRWHIKKGSFWNTNGPTFTAQPVTYPLTVKFKNLPEYSWLTFSSDRFGLTTSPNTGIGFLESNRYWFSDSSKLYVQIEKGDKAYYSYFDIAKGTTEFIADMSLVIKKSESKIISFPENDYNGYIQVEAAGIGKNGGGYLFASRNFLGTKAQVFIPQEKFAQFNLEYRYQKKGLSYHESYRIDHIPEKTEGFEASYVIEGKSLADFVPRFTGKFDYYYARFITRSKKLVVDVLTPSSGDHTKNIIPDLDEIIGTDVNWSDYELQSMQMVQKSTYKEDRLNYNDVFSFPYSQKSVTGYTHLRDH